MRTCVMGMCSSEPTSAGAHSARASAPAAKKPAACEAMMPSAWYRLSRTCARARVAPGDRLGLGYDILLYPLRMRRVCGSASVAYSGAPLCRAWRTALREERVAIPAGCDFDKTMP
jgi:hypothetical protein